MLACKCLNVIIESEGNDFQEVTPASLGLTQDENHENFFKQDLRQVSKLSQIVKEHSNLVVSKTVGAWIVHKCINCDMYTHAIHRERGAACVLVSPNLLADAAIESVRDDDSFSKTFKVVVKPQHSDDPRIESLSSDVQLALNQLKQRGVEVLSREVVATEERIRQYSEQQSADLDFFRERIYKEQEALVRVILKNSLHKRDELSTNDMSSPITTMRLSSETVPVQSNKVIIDKPKHNIVAHLKSKPKHTIRQLSTPLANSESFDSEGLFLLEGMDESNSGSASNASDSDNDDTMKDENNIPRRRSQPTCIARSLPMTIPIFQSSYRTNLEEEHDDINACNRENPLDIAASIKALAKSVHGDAVFGDLPRPRFSTQI